MLHTPPAFCSAVGTILGATAAAAAAAAHSGDAIRADARAVEAGVEGIRLEFATVADPAHPAGAQAAARSTASDRHGAGHQESRIDS